MAYTITVFAINVDRLTDTTLDFIFDGLGTNNELQIIW